MGRGGSPKGEGVRQADVPPRRGRPPGKRSDPDFVQTTGYVRAETYRRVRIALLEEGAGREYSELIEELLNEWLSRK